MYVRIHLLILQTNAAVSHVFCIIRCLVKAQLTLEMRPLWMHLPIYIMHALQLIDELGFYRSDTILIVEFFNRPYNTLYYNNKFRLVKCLYRLRTCTIDRYTLPQSFRHHSNNIGFCRQDRWRKRSWPGFNILMIVRVECTYKFWFCAYKYLRMTY